MIGWLIAAGSIGLASVALWSLARQVGRPIRLKTWTPLIGLVFAPATLLVNLFFLRQAAPGVLGPGVGLIGVVFGVFWGRTTTLRLTEERSVEAERSILHLILWGVSFAVTQVLAAFAEARWVAGGLVAMFFATGVALGSNADLLWHLWRVRTQASPMSDSPRTSSGGAL